MNKEPHSLAHAGRRLLNRRGFLRFGGAGLGGVALTALLAEQGLLAADAAARPVWRFPPRRLEAERLCDAILAVGGNLDFLFRGPWSSGFEPKHKE